MENKIERQFMNHLQRDKNLFADFQLLDNFYALDQQILNAIRSAHPVRAEQLLETLTFDLLKLPVTDEYRSVRFYYRGLVYHVIRMIPVDNPNVQTALTYTSALLILIDELTTTLDFIDAVPVIVDSLTKMMAFLSPPVSTNPNVTTIIYLIEDHLQEPALSLPWIAQRIGMSNNYLSALFKQEVGESVPERIRRRRIDASIADLLGTNLPICAIGKKYCFTSCTAYITTFKTYKQMTPLRYRQLFLTSKKRDAST
ncbi:AraC family transcriptional regulator [Exiguobacterium sp. SH1S21]|uniref:helix-turn-helix transcriptional regulator n=1 Tax=Exiguobacterium sp. SH1S21 TaxID=2510953 RepID=UPI001039BA95|nr:helix-turn-helix transcriptional regulator [Exiguobacterium sp. SH1S21]TCI57606.1 AraC family transcriptional regulator [Exiguobacterium sp. SH1S21]